MRSITKCVMTLLFTLALANSLYAETAKTVQFENQREEIFDLENWLKKIEYKKEMRDTTCYRTGTRQVYRCHDVTRYRQECETVPAHQECGTVYDQVCRTENRSVRECHTERGGQNCRVVTRYRQECSTVGGGEQCRTIPGDVQCSIVNGENRCVKIPPRQECSGTPSRQECRQVPYEERECSDGPSREVCEYVNRPEQVCESRPRQQCQTVPAERVCSQVPYSVNECGNETEEYDIPYACKKEVDVPYETILKTHKANVQMLFDSKATEAKTELTVALNDKGELAISGKELAGNSALAFAKKEVKTEAAGDVNNIKGVFNVSFVDKKDLFDVSSKGLSDVKIGKRSLSFVVNGKFDQKNATLAVKIAKKDDVKFEKVLKASQFSAKFDGAVTRVEVDLEAAGAPKLGGLFNKTHQVTLKLKIDSGSLGQLVSGSELSVQTSVEAKVE